MRHRHLRYTGGLGVKDANAFYSIAFSLPYLAIIAQAHQLPHSFGSLRAPRAFVWRARECLITSSKYYKLSDVSSVALPSALTWVVPRCHSARILYSKRKNPRRKKYSKAFINRVVSQDRNYHTHAGSEKQHQPITGSTEIGPTIVK